MDNFSSRPEWIPTSAWCDVCKQVAPSPEIRQKLNHIRSLIENDPTNESIRSLLNELIPVGNTWCLDVGSLDRSHRIAQHSYMRGENYSMNPLTYYSDVKPDIVPVEHWCSACSQINPPMSVRRDIEKIRTFLNDDIHNTEVDEILERIEPMQEWILDIGTINSVVRVGRLRQQSV